MERIKEGGPTRPAEARLRTLFLAGLAGDAESYRSFLDSLSGHLRAFLRKRLYQSPDDVEDIVQEALLAVHNARHTYEPDQPLTAWVHAVARYKLMDYFRARSRHEALNEPLDDYVDFFETSDSIATDARRDVGKLLDALPDKQRLPIVHVKLQGLSVAETAELTGLSESAVKVGIHRGLKALALKVKDLL
ncbi:sigma-70 family RNA polymerase sigma factor [Trinickia sp. NRRL B-1857]|uniref:sigma-70 family RNA polymerase sigma factor n=1 Tax=Trinickia sp. NRRL B-1857 TaxID=3162879 RepID=UPI003D27A232